MRVLLVGFALLTAACTPSSYPIAGADPADPSAPVPTVRYQSTLGSYVSQRPVGPGNWREQNERVTPKEQR